MVLLFLILSIAVAKAHNLQNGSATAGSLRSSSALQMLQKDLKKQVLEVSPLDVQNNSSPYLRQGPTLDSLLGFGDSSNALTSSLAQLNDISSTGLDFNNLNLGSNGLADVEQMLRGQAPVGNSAQGLGSLFATNTNDQTPNLLQSVLSGQSVTSPVFPSNYAYPSQYQTVVSTGNDQLLNSLQSVLSPRLSVSNDVSLSNMDNLALLLGGSSGQLTNTVLPQQLTSLTDPTSIFGSLQPTPELPIEPKFSPLTNLNIDESILTDINNSPTIDSLQPLLTPHPVSTLAASASLLPSLSFPNSQSQSTQLIFDNQVPNLNNYACKLAFQSLVYKAYKDYLKLAAFPSCNLPNQQPYYDPTTDVPFKIIVVKENIEKPAINPILLKLVWLLLQRQKVPRSDSFNIPPQIILSPPTQEPSPLPLQYLLTILNLLNNPKYRPNNQFLIDIIRKRVPESIPLPLPLPTPSVPLPLPDILNMDNESKNVMSIFQKYFPQRRFTQAEIIFLVKLVQILPRSINELLHDTQLLKSIIYELSVRNLNPKLILAIIYSNLINLPSSSSRAVELVYRVKKTPAIVYHPYYYVKYLVPYDTFVQKLYRLLLYKPQLINNRDLLFKELLAFALANNGLSAELNGVPKENLVQLITNNGAVVPLDVKVIPTTNVLNEQLKVLSDLSALSLNSERIGGSPLSSFWNSLTSQNSNVGGSSGSGIQSALFNQNLGVESNFGPSALSVLLNQNAGNFDTAAPNIFSSFINKISGGGQGVVGSLGSGFGAGLSSLDLNLGSGLGSARSGLDAGSISGLGSDLGSGLDSGLGSTLESALRSTLRSGPGSKLGSAHADATR